MTGSMHMKPNVRELNYYLATFKNRKYTQICVVSTVCCKDYVIGLTGPLPLLRVIWPVYQSCFFFCAGFSFFKNNITGSKG